ncbi:hypothetical protein [Desulfolucanica intricata]|uniref:hypothetical protein n=1 Tax=Desulfolucanica intricata TaxID=1285191 RepID=UPI0008319A02|nr:hypothetical protein [Desulfolucanica intricata]
MGIEESFLNHECSILIGSCTEFEQNISFKPAFTVPFKLYQEMEASVEGSVLETRVWQKLQERQ